MNKKEKLEQLYLQAQELGLSSREVGEYFLSKDVKAPSVVQEYQTPAEVLPGMYVYADGLISAELITGRQVKAVVGYVEGKTVYAVCLKAKELPWSSDCLEVKASRDLTDGKEATAVILAAAKQKRGKAEAAQWCHDYAEDGVIQGEAFLPSLTELEKLFANKAAINASLKALGVALLEGWYWSSTESISNYAWGFIMGNGYRGSSNKSNGTNSVRAVITILL
ncbi:MAG: hypothetical protein OSJ76_02485 [Alphaproteobacteria bacterium]|nr:hypothetical protein [Alphaproteobacteria bacterium]